MFKLFRSLVSGLSAATDVEVEMAYLNASVSLADLERRQREIEQGLLRRQGFAF